MAASSANGEGGPMMAARGARPARRRHRPSRGFTYLGVLIAVALMGIGLAVVSEVWTKVAERQKIAQLEWVMDQYAKAIESYYYANTGSVNFYPEKVEDLLEDKRHLGVVRHLRRLYVNPMSGEMDWKWVAGPSKGIAGVETSVEGRVFKRLFSPWMPSTAP